MIYALKKFSSHFYFTLRSSEPHVPVTSRSLLSLKLGEANKILLKVEYSTKNKGTLNFNLNYKI